MQTKLTLRMDDELIFQAKQVAETRGKSVSQMVAEYFKSLSSKATLGTLPPLTRSLKGVLRKKRLSESDYKAHLVKKHR